MAIKTFPAIRIASTNLPIKELLPQMQQAAQENPDVQEVVASYCGQDVILHVGGEFMPERPWHYGPDGWSLDLQGLHKAMFGRRHDIGRWAHVHPEEEC